LQNDLVLHLWYQVLELTICFQPLNSRTVTTAAMSLSTSFTTHQITKKAQVKQHRHTGIQNDYGLFICCQFVQWSLVVGCPSSKTRLYVLC
jgi:hypothetical protein